MEFWKLYNNLQSRLLASGLETNQLAQRHTESQWAIRLVLQYCWGLGHYTWCQESSLSEFWFTPYHGCPITSPPRHLLESQGSTESWTQPHVRLHFRLDVCLIPLGSLGFPDSSSGFPWFLSWLLRHICPLVSVGGPWVVVHFCLCGQCRHRDIRMCLGVSYFRTAHLISENEYFLLVLPTKLLSLKCFGAWDRWTESQLLALTSEAYSF